MNNSNTTTNLGQSLIPLINQLQDAFSVLPQSQHSLHATIQNNLPQVAVVGSQSSGKSSLLEALVGKDFLPRGNDIVTRRPLILQLIHSYGSSSSWGEFLHKKSKKYYDFNAIKEEIASETDRVVSGVQISSDPIRLRIFSPHVLTMTLVDLPGMTRVPVGDQPPDIEKQIRKLILKYISAPSCIILAVSPANQDLASSDALELAKRVDPEGLRTVGVLTKLDIMDRGTDAVKMLKNEVVPLKLGYVGVVLRSQRDIMNSTSMDHAKDAEIEFFKRHREYDDVYSHCCTTSVLAQKLNKVLVQAIREALPSLRQSLERALEKKRAESRMYGDAPPCGMNRGAMLLSIVDSYSGRFAAALQGRGDQLPLEELAGGARIRHIFLNVFNPALDDLDPASELTDDEIRTAIKNSGGITGSLLIPEAPFEMLVKRAIERLLRPSLQCREFIHEELIKIAAHSAPPEVTRFPKLKTYMMEAVEDFISLGASPAESMIRNLIDCELALINTSNPSFIGGNEAIARVLKSRGTSSGGPPLKSRRIEGLKDMVDEKKELFSANGWFANGWFEGSTAPKQDEKKQGETSASSLQRPPETLKVSNVTTEQEAVQVEVTRVLIHSYFDIVRKNMQDLVPKIVMNFMVNHVQKGLQKQLTHVLYREDLLELIMREREDIAERRHQCQEAVRTLRKAMKLLDSISYSSTSTSLSQKKWGKDKSLGEFSPRKILSHDQNTNTLN